MFSLFTIIIYKKFLMDFFIDQIHVCACYQFSDLKLFTNLPHYDVCYALTFFNWLVIRQNHLKNIMEHSKACKNHSIVSSCKCGNVSKKSKNGTSCSFLLGEKLIETFIANSFHLSCNADFRLTLCVRNAPYFQW